MPINLTEQIAPKTKTMRDAGNEEGEAGISV